LSDTAGIGANGGIGRRANVGNGAIRYHFTFALALCLDFTPPVMQFIQNNWPLILVMILSGGMLLWPLIGRRFSKVGEVGALGATQLINRQNAVMLDLRETKDYDGGHVPNAVHIPLSQLASRGGELSKLTSRPLIAYCDRGSRSRSAGAALSKLGFAEVYTLRGGVRAWVEAGLPIAKNA
jgi:rhodanese-related sulfurtransferase